LGDEEIISKNKETINKPAIAAPIIIGDPISFLATYPARGSPANFFRLPYRPLRASLSYSLCFYSDLRFKRCRWMRPRCRSRG